ncbi:SDR family NAD(P)-dependent oxidoreductase [Novosphingobium sp.]|uniref:SDR family NAD(P)-dependent oxidoreductase n=1 Tax=Novosphingobium sp. TaxID=1874826 RepID=UPI0033412C1F
MRLFVFGMGYSAGVLARRLSAQGWRVDGTGRGGTIAFDDSAAVHAALARASHVLSSVPPSRDGTDAVLATYGGALCDGLARWIGYLSSTGVYGDCGGAWVDETAPIGHGRRSARSEADLAWQALDAQRAENRVRVFRLPGIYGPGRSAFDRLRDGSARRLIAPGQVFSRVHVDDIAGGVIAGMAGPAGVYNLADDEPCDANAVIEEAARLMGVIPPPLVPLADAALSPMALAFYAENRRVANGRARRVLGWRPRFPTYREGLRDLSATTSPVSDSAAPAALNADQR